MSLDNKDLLIPPTLRHDPHQPMENLIKNFQQIVQRLVGKPLPPPAPTPVLIPDSREFALHSVH
ncbi:hypothetical protein Ciccas_010662 [Cichlidogyrus casuarinus]|uniref:Uncharacterized protein n=1 Tax=Cichlidogyrus casuarinus TaxID=1844966 RepID=A0ABD2PVI7_9PLAT